MLSLLDFSCRTLFCFNSVDNDMFSAPEIPKFRGSVPVVTKAVPGRAGAGRQIAGLPRSLPIPVFHPKVRDGLSHSAYAAQLDAFF